MEFAAVRQALDRGDLAPFREKRQGHAGEDAAAVDMHGARAEMSAISRAKMAEALVADARGNVADQGAGYDEVASAFEPPSAHIAVRRETGRLPKRANEMKRTECGNRSEPAHRKLILGMGL